MKVKEIMIEDVLMIDKNESVTNLMKCLTENKIGGVPVVDQDHHLLGMISDGDVIRALSPREQNIFDFYSLIVLVEKPELKEQIRRFLEKSVEQVMTKRKIEYVKPEDSLQDILNILSHHHFKKIPVIDDDNKVVGVVSRGDVIRYITKQMLE
ncbi:CBS domain-containing protein [Terrilactibacillus sp. BCM23-1]|uniref:CBS domain-containing protein n=1 Tax=Terrilactibacillus tamarindi TaxID=2599694 RepID=A0A6N8CWB3_9BACI|nr:CBS domain-containing protein [Terrilactibacillus tamarindi]MTT32886.1 CBS domain-containing protein [Terrilactibacillus tamarindi]